MLYLGKIFKIMDRLQSHFNKLLQGVNTDFHRYLYGKINWNNRLIGITGPRGVGKTTMILQNVKENLLQKLRLNERNVNLFTNCTASDSNFNEVKGGSIN